MSAPGESARRWVISGRVQGVGFRWFTMRRAQTLGIVGWVRNLPDGRVEVMGRGDGDALDRLDDSLRTGPRLARVDSVERRHIPHELVDYKIFDVK